MCGHQWKQINDITVCLQCGLTLAGNKAFFDPGLRNQGGKKRGKNKRAVSGLPCRD